MTRPANPYPGRTTFSQRRHKVYHGRRDHFGVIVIVSNGHHPAPLPERLEIVNHSPTGFAWGYHGSGPAQLALAILCDYFGDAFPAQTMYQQFKTDVIAKLQGDEWTLDCHDLDRWLSGKVGVPGKERAVARALQESLHGRKR